MPRLGQPVAGTLGRDRATVQLAREPDSEVADVDHLLDLAEPLLRDLPDLEGDERAERLLLAAELVAEEPDELTASRCWDVAPGLEGGRGAPDRSGGLGLARPRDARDLLAGDRRLDDEVAVADVCAVDAESLHEGGCGGGPVERRHRLDCRCHVPKPG
jgi:hypothetical protein